MKRLWSALFYSLDGLAAAFRHEEAFRIEVLLSLILVPLALHMHVSAVAKALMIGSIALVLVAELVNSSIEAITDRISLENHVLAKRAKDMGSAAVMISLVFCAGVWGTALYRWSTLGALPSLCAFIAAPNRASIPPMKPQPEPWAAGLARTKGNWSTVAVTTV